MAPQKIMYKNATSGKIQFRHARIRARSFRFVKGEHYVRMYYVSKPSRNQALKKKSPKSSNEEVGAHSFCSRCGVNILYAPNSHSTALEINLDCLDQDDLKLRPAVVKDGNLSRGFAVVQQWDEDQENGRYPSTIVEENPMAIFPPLDQQQSPFSGLQPNVLKQQDSMTEPDSLYDGDDDTINSDAYCVRTNGSKLDPGTPSTVCTSQTAERIVSFSSNHNLHGVLPSLSLDTPRASSNDTESVASITSSRSAFPSSSSDTLFTRQHSSSSRSLSISTAGPMMRHQMKYYMQKHMSSSPTASSMTSPTSGSEPKKNTLEVPTRIIKKW